MYLSGLHCAIFLYWQYPIGLCFISKTKVRARIDAVAGTALIGLGVELAVSD